MYSKTVLLGRLGQDPELKTLRNDNAVCTLSVATDHRARRDGQWEKETTWHRVVAWGRTADAAAEYLKKGDTVLVEGRISHRQWEDKDGNKRTTTEIVANDVKFLPRGGQSQGGGSRRGSKGSPNVGGRDYDDDMPF